MVGDRKNRDDVTQPQQALKGRHRGVILLGIKGVSPCLIQVAFFIVLSQDSSKDIGAISFVMESRLSGEDQEMSTVIPPSNILLQE